MRLRDTRIVGHLDLQRGALITLAINTCPVGRTLSMTGTDSTSSIKSGTRAQQTLDQLRNFQSSPNSLGVRQTNVVAALIGEAEYILDFAGALHHIIEVIDTRFILSLEKLISTRFEI